MENLEVRFTTEVGTINEQPFEDIKEWIALAVQENKEMIISLDNVKEGKEIVAKYRKLRTSLEDERKRIKKEWNKPYEAWETKYKDSIAALDETINGLSSQIREIEDREEEKRVEAINAEILKDAKNIRRGLDEILQTSQALWSKVCKTTYYNKSCSRIKSTEEWRVALSTISRDLDVINEGEDKDTLFQSYIKTADLAASMQEVKEAKKIAASSITPTATVKEAEIAVTKTFTTISIPVPAPDKVSAEEAKTVRANRVYIGPRYKIMLLLKFAEELGLEMQKPEIK